jgi:hypothetical protein
LPSHSTRSLPSCCSSWQDACRTNLWNHGNHWNRWSLWNPRRWRRRWFTWPPAFQGSLPWAPKLCGPASCRCCSAQACTRSH